MPPDRYVTSLHILETSHPHIFTTARPRVLGAARGAVGPRRRPLERPASRSAVHCVGVAAWRAAQLIEACEGVERARAVSGGLASAHAHAEQTDQLCSPCSTR